MVPNLSDIDASCPLATTIAKALARYTEVSIEAKSVIIYMNMNIGCTRTKKDETNIPIINIAKNNVNPL